MNSRTWDRRPYLVLTRDAAIPGLHNIVCAPVTTTIRNIPSELPLAESDGMPRPCVASFDNVQVIPKSHLVARLTRLGPEQLDRLCAALRNSVAC